MKQNSNAEKQARYRKKEKLRRQAEMYLFGWGMNNKASQNSSDPQELRDLVEAAIWLPSGWTDEDYLKAEQELERVYSEKILSDQYSMGLFGSEKYIGELWGSPSLKREEDTNPLASHIISALKLFGTNEAEQATALLKAMRFVGKKLINNREVPYSLAVAMCLVTIGPNYTRPGWLPGRLAHELSRLFKSEHLEEMINNLKSNDKDSN